MVVENSVWENGARKWGSMGNDFKAPENGRRREELRKKLGTACIAVHSH
jgi:hypothetical protein